MTTYQNEFTAALLNPDLDTPAGVVDPDGRPAGKRFDVYRNNVVHSLIDAMSDAFPAVKKIVGNKFFDAMAGIYVRENPPRTPMMMFYGENLPHFIGEFEPAKSLPYLPDVARLELARRECYHGADATALPPAALAEVDPDLLMGAQFEMAPSLVMIESLFPIHSIWHFNMVSQVKISNPQEWIMLTRPELDVVPYLLDFATYEFILRLQLGATLDSALEKATEIDTEFDLSAAFGLMFQSGIVTKIKT